MGPRLAILNQFFLSSWDHFPELPSCRSLPGPLKAVLFWDTGPPSPPQVVLSRGKARLCGTRPSRFWGIVPGPPGYFNSEMLPGSLRILFLIAQKWGSGGAQGV